MGYGGYEKSILNTPHLQFIVEKDTGKTMVYSVRTTHISNPEMSKLGVIKWYGSWRKYCYFPLGDTVYDDRCMTQIIHFMNLCKIAWKEGRKGVNPDDVVCQKCLGFGVLLPSCEDCHGTLNDYFYYGFGPGFSLAY